MDWLLRDLGLPTRRARGVFAEWIGCFAAERYRELAAERHDAR